MAHFTMVPNATTIPTRTTVASQAPIGTPLSPRPSPSLPPGYNALNASIPIPTQVPSGASGVFSPPGHNPVVGFILTLPQPPSGGSYPPFTGGSGPSGITQSFTPNYQIPVGGQFNPGGQSQPPFGGQTPIGTQPPVGGQPPPTPPYGQNIPTALAQYWNFLTQGNTQSTGGKQPQVISFIPPSTGQPYPGLPIPFGVRTFNLVSLSKGTSLISTTPRATCLHTHNRICQDLRIICKLLTVLLVYRRDFLPKVTSTLT
jgi:hypothetical protein